MKDKISRVTLLSLLFLIVTVASKAQNVKKYNGPIIDMHMHAYYMGFNIPNPITEKILVRNPGEHLETSLAQMKNNNIVLGLVSGTNIGDYAENSQELDRWRKEAGEKILKGLFLGIQGFPPVDSLKVWFTSGKYDFLGELGFQYAGRSPSEPAFYKYYELAQELNIPVGIHTGQGGPGTPYTCCPDFRLSIGNPYLLEDVLVHFPALRIWAMHAGGQYYNEMVTMMRMYPQLYVDISVYTWLQDGMDGILERFLKLAKEQKVLDRVMFGSDQQLWPETIEWAVKRINSLDYLTDSEKADIFYNNAARFLKLSDEKIAKDHGK